MPIIETRGSLSSRGYGQFAQSAAPAPAAAYIEDVFSTWLYTGNGSTQTITNGIDLATKGGLVWIKRRSAVDSNWLFDTNRGMTFSSASYVSSNSTSQQFSDVNLMMADATGFSWGSNSSTSAFNGSGTYASWTFAKQPKFFDVVTYTGNGASSQIVSHSLGVAPACIITKKTSAAQNWRVYTRRNDTVWTLLYLNLTNAGADFNYSSISPALTSTTIDFGYISSYIEGGNNDNGATYVAYLFAHNAGGFGASGTDNVISCGSFTGSGAGISTTINLGYEPQFILAKRVDVAQNWVMFDNMRGMSNTAAALLHPNLSNAETSQPNTGYFTPTATGFVYGPDNFIGDTAQIIYIAIRRGPMRTPTSGTSVFSPLTQAGANVTAGQTLTTGFPVDLEISEGRSVNSGGYFVDRLRGGQNYLTSFNTAAEVNFTGWTPLIGFANNTGITDANYGSTSQSYVAWNFRRAPGFFDVVCYTGTGVARTVNHNLGVVPEMVIIKSRSNAVAWPVWSAYGTQRNDFLVNLNGAGSYGTAGDLVWGTPGSGVPNMTSTLFSVGDAVTVNNSGWTYVAYLFASCPGVSKVGTYTGTGSTVQVNCGFTSGARFVLIKRTDSTGDWYIWDSARGIIASNDPYLVLNSNAAEVTSTDWVDTLATGFEVSNAGSNLVNVNGGTYIFLAIA